MTRGTAYEGTVEGGPLTQRITQCRAYYRTPAFADLSRSGAEPSRSRLGNRRRCAAAPVTGSPSAATGGRRPQIVRRVRPREGGPLRLVHAAAPASDQPMPIQDRMHGTDRRAVHLRVLTAQPFADLRSTPVRPSGDTPATASAYPPQMPKSVTYVSGIKCHPSIRKGTQQRQSLTYPVFLRSQVVAGLLRDSVSQAFCDASISFESSA